MMALLSCTFIWSNGASRVSSSLMMCQPLLVCTGSAVDSPFLQELDGIAERFDHCAQFVEPPRCAAVRFVRIYLWDSAICDILELCAAP